MMQSHAIHHASAGHLDKRGTGDIYTMTVQEYLESTRWKRFSYRLARNPIVLFVIAPLYIFVISQRFPSSKASRRERHSVYWMNLAILAMAAGFAAIFGIIPYLVIQLTAMAVAGSAGVWLFLRATPIRRGVLGTRRRMGLYRRRTARQFILQTAEDIPVVLRQHRLPSHSSFEFPDSQLQPREMPPCASAFPAGQAGHTVLQLEVIHLSSLG
jgi:hypothetical protein